MAKDDSKQAFTFETVAILVASLQQKGVNLGKGEFDLMALLDGNRTSSGFEHLFRGVKARARELNGIEATPKKGGKRADLATPSSKNRNTKRARDAAADDDEQADDEEASPSKRVKKEEE